MTTRTFQISIPTDPDGFLGRQCTQKDCRKYFKIKPGTGLPKPTRAFCPYCGHADSPNDFWTDEQKDYALSIVGNKVMGEVAQTLRKHEFNIRPRGPFGIGFSLKIRHTPDPIRYYAEREVETPLKCERCTLDYAIYGLFAFCPDCGTHNSLQILSKNFEVISKLILLGEGADADVVSQLTTDALENAVSTFDGFGREVCRVAAPQCSDPAKAAAISFQSIEGARQRILDLFGFDFASKLTPDEWIHVVRCFKKRHVIAHKLGVMDVMYVQSASDPNAIAGRKVSVSREEIESLGRSLARIGEHLTKQLGL